MKPFPPNVEPRFLRGTNKNGPMHPYDPEKGRCWIWTGMKNRKGYGLMKIGRRGFSCHRVSFEMHTRELSPGECALHTCDRPSCVNPSHIYAGSNQDNVNDKMKRGRFVPFGPVPADRRARGAKNGAYTKPHRVRKGSNNGRSKLNERQIPAIRGLLIGGVSRKAIAKTYSVSEGLIDQIAQGKIWRHVPKSTETLKRKELA